LAELYDKDLVKIAAAHQSDNFVSVTSEEPATTGFNKMDSDDIKRRDFV
jgi:hypothetical protein